MSYAQESRAAASIAGTVNRANVIHYNALTNRLFGRIGGSSFGPWSAVSGAGMNSARDQPHVTLANWLPGKKKTGTAAGSRGGVIPPGWWIALPEVLARGHRSRYAGGLGAPTDHSIKLVPFLLRQVGAGVLGECERGGFYIHGASKSPLKTGSGSDGCILLGPAERTRLAMQVFRAKGAWLHVSIDAQRLNQIFEFQEAASRTA